MAPRVLIAGGYGLVGGNIARHIRTVSQNVEFVLAGRSPDKGLPLARELGGTRTTFLDVGNAVSVADAASADLIISALYDPANALVEAALKQGVAHIGITTKADDVAPIALAALRTPPRRPIVLLGHCAAGVATLAAQTAAQDFSRVDAIEIAALYDVRDPVGPMTASDAEMLVSRALLREQGAWRWLDGRLHPRLVRLGDGTQLEAHPAGLLDAPSLASITGAPNVRCDMMQGDSLGTRGGGRASSDAYVDMTGVLQSGAPGTRRTTTSDPNGLAHLTALGVLVAAERVLGLDGRAPAAGGLHVPETLVQPQAAIERFRQFGVRITSQEGDVL